MKIIKKIKGLLSKTVENGATEAEALSALNKANALLKEHNLSLSEVNSLYPDEQPVLYKIDLDEYSPEPIEDTIERLSKMFGCSFYYPQKGKKKK